MAEFVIGTGHRKTIRECVRIIEQHLVRVEGNPRKVLLRSEGFECTAERREFKGEFDQYSLKVRVPTEVANALKALAKERADYCSLREEAGTLVINCPPSGRPQSAESIETLDQFCSKMSLPEVWRGSGDLYRVDRISPELIFQAIVQYKASDVHLSPGVNPVFRIDNDMRSSELIGALSAVQIQTLIKDTAAAEYWEEFEKTKQTSYNYHQAGIGYARVSAFIKSGAPHCTLRYLPEKPPTFEMLHIPRETMTKLAELHRGLLLVTGMTGSGKTTTCAALIDYINAHRQAHILTIENPVEYVHANKKSVLSQRSLGMDVSTFQLAVTGALRHDPDVLLIGEMRDPDTIRAAINAAATGHLVISTLHANSAPEVVNRIVSFFDPVERDLVKLQLRDCLQCVISQRLLPMVGGGRVPALEVMFNDVKAINTGILEGNTDLIRIGMQQTVSHSWLFEQYLMTLYKEGKITIEAAREFCSDVSIFDQMLMGTYSVPRLDSIKGGGAH